MRTPVQSVPFNFRVSPQILAAVREQARRAGVSPSEYMRHKLCAELEDAA